MKLIEYNPFRILGIAVNASAKELAGNLSKKRLLDIGRDVSFPLDLPSLLQSVARTSDAMNEAEKAINLPQDKIRNALFWFAQPSDPIGKLAYDHLLQGNVEKALELFRKSKVWESKLCLSTLNLQLGHYGEAMLCFWEVSQNCTEFCTTICGQTFTMTDEELTKLYIETLANEVDVITLYNSWGKYDLLPGGSEIIEFTLRDMAVDIPTKAIEKAIATAKSVEKGNADAQLEAGRQLVRDTRQLLPRIREITGVSDARYSRLADKLAGQILQCSINYHNALDSVNASVIDTCLKMAQYAKSLAVGKLTLQRLDESIKTLEKKKSELPPVGMEEHDAAIKARIVELVLINGRTINNAIQMMKDIAPHIVAIKEQANNLNTYYLDISTQVVNAALSSVIEEYNEVTNKLGVQLQNAYTRTSALNSLKDILKRAWKATLMMDKFDVKEDFKQERYFANRKALAEMYDNVFGSFSSTTTSIGYDEFDLRTEEEMFKGCLSSIQYQSYMKRYPNGKYVAEARDRYQRLLVEEEKKRKEKEEKERKARIKREADDKAYNSCTSISDYEIYLRNHPNGRHTHEAKQKIKSKKESLTNVLSVILVELVWLIIGLICDDYDTNWWAVFLGGTIGGWLFYVNILAFTFFNWLISKIIDNEN